MTTREFLALPPAKARFIQPMILSEVRALPEGSEWAFEAKLDGYRCLAARNGGVTLWSRRGALFTPRFPEVARACEKLPPDTFVDREVVAVDQNGRASFNLLQHHASKPHLQFYVFDMPVYRGRGLLHVPLETRRALLEEALEKVGYPVLFSRSFEALPWQVSRSLSAKQRLGQVQGERLPGICDRRLYAGRSLRCSHRRLLRARKAKIRCKSQKRFRPSCSPGRSPTAQGLED
jgi:bifunctional non-homologous end joining protein LigD